MRIVIVHNRRRSAFPSGEDRVVDTETAALQRAGHDVIVYQRRSDEIVALPAWRRAAIPLAVVRNPTARRALAQVLDRVRPDVVHVHNTFPLLSGAVLRAAAAACIPIVTTLHNYRLACSTGEFFRDGNACHDCCGRIGLPAIAHGCYRGSRIASTPVALGAIADARDWRQLPAAYIFVSEWQRRALRGVGLPEDRCHVKWNLVMHQPARPESCPDGTQVVYAGRLDEAKGVRVLMAAWDRFTAACPTRAGLRLVIAGSGVLAPEVYRWANGRDDVEAPGLLDQTACAQLVANARVVVVPSAWEETFGLSVVEAMAAGVPTIAAAHGALPELVRDGRDGVLFRPGDPDDLARMLRSVASDRATCRMLGAAARRGYRDRFDPAENLSQLLRIYQHALDQPRRRRHTNGLPMLPVPQASVFRGTATPSARS